jgi:hypothetical protein
MTGSAKQDCFEQELGRRRVLTIDASDAIVLRHTEEAGLRRLELAISNDKIVPRCSSFDPPSPDE